MKIPKPSRILLLAAGSALLATPATAQTDSLPSWNDGPAKQAIVKFVGDVTKPGVYARADDVLRVDMKKDWKRIYPFEK